MMLGAFKKYIEPCVLRELHMERVMDENLSMPKNSCFLVLPIY